MTGLELPLALAAFIAGLLMFLAPCTLPLVPAYLAFISGVNPGEAEKSKEVRRKLQRNALAFVVGFSVVFISFGILAGFFGSFVGQYRMLLSQVGGVFIIIFGLMMLGTVRLAPLLKDRKVPLPKTVTPGEPTSAFLIGAIFALGWTPCVGPVLASVLLLATTGSTVVSGGLLLAVFSVGLAMPFLATAFLYGRAQSVILKYSSISHTVNIVGGIFLIFIGVLLLSGSFGLTVQYGYVLFETLNIEALYDFY